MLGLMQMPEPFSQIRAILDGQSYQKWLEVRTLGLDRFPPGEVGRESLGASTDCAQRAEQVLFAELGRVELHLIDGEEVPKQQVVAAALDLCRHRLMLGRLGHILRCVESAFLCFAVTFNPFG